MTLKKLIQDIKTENKLTYSEMSKITSVPKLTLQNYGCARNENISYRNAKKIYESININWETLQQYVR